MKLKIYIAGKVTGENKMQCINKFKEAERQINELGHEAINPLRVVGTFDVTWETAMKKCIKALMDCDVLLFLPCTDKSPGATWELEIANKLKIPTSKLSIEVIKQFKKEEK